MQLANRVTIRNKGFGPIVHEVDEASVCHAIYLIRDLYSSYDQFQLAIEKRNLITIKTPLGLVQIYTLLQGASNSVAHMQNEMNRILKDFVLKKTIPFVDNIPIKGCREETKDVTVETDGCRTFVKQHIKEVERIMKRLEEVNLTLSIDKSKFGIEKIIIVGHLCRSYERKLNLDKVDIIL